MKKVLCLVLAFAMLFSLTGFQSALAQEPVTITVWSGYPDQQAWFDWLTEAFMAENPDIKVELTTFPIADFETKVFAALPAGTCADVITINPSYVYSFAAGGKFAPVPDNLKALVTSGIYDEAVVLFLFIFLFSVVQFVFGDDERIDKWRIKRNLRRERAVRKEAG